MADIVCMQCGVTGPPGDDRCQRCGGSQVLPADAPLARKFLAELEATRRSAAADSTSVRANATGKVLGRALGRLLKK
jgi:ribosomal protein L40E